MVSGRMTKPYHHTHQRSLPHLFYFIHIALHLWMILFCPTFAFILGPSPSLPFTIILFLFLIIPCTHDWFILDIVLCILENFRHATTFFHCIYYPHPVVPSHRTGTLDCGLIGGLLFFFHFPSYSIMHSHYSLGFLQWGGIYL